MFVLGEAQKPCKPFSKGGKMKYRILASLLTLCGGLSFADTQVPGEYIVHAPKGVALSEFQQQLEQQNPMVKLIDQEKGWFLVQRPAIENDVFSVMNASSTLPFGTFLEPNVIFTINEIPDDEMVDMQPNLFGRVSVDQKDCMGRTLSDIKSVGMENLSILRENTALVAVVDTGVDLDHEDLVSQIFTNEAEASGTPGVDDDNNGYIDDIHGYNFYADQPDGNDDNGHGTHVAGVISAMTNNSKGVSGITGASILPVKFLSASGSGTLDGALQALAYAEKMGAKVINASFGGSSDSEALREKFSDLEAKGILVAVAAGNDGQDLSQRPTYPALFPHSNIVTVAASKADGTIARFSNRSSVFVEISGPGENILSTYKDNSYKCLSGTSMATPHVAAALSLAASLNPGASHEEIIEQVLQAADSTEELKAYVEGGRFLRIDKILQ